MIRPRPCMRSGMPTLFFLQKTALLNTDRMEDFRLGKALQLYKSEEANIAYTDTLII